MTRTIDALNLVGPSRYVESSQTLADVLARTDADLYICAPATPPGRDLSRANATLFDAAAPHADRIGVLARVDPLDPDGRDYAGEAIARGCLGLYADPWRDSYSVVDCPALDEFAVLAASAGLPLVVEAGYPALAEPAQIGAFAVRHPDLTLVATRGLQMNMSGLALDTALHSLERAENLYLLTTGVYRQDWLGQLCDVGMASRVLYASGSPSFTPALERERVAHLAQDSDRLLVARENAKRVFGLES